MEESKLVWKVESSENIFDCKIFSIHQNHSISPENELHTYTVIDAKDWVIVLPELETPEGKKFLMVWQWRHGLQGLSLEFPGGVIEKGESPEDAAQRELLEETGYKAGSVRKMGEFSPNPAIMSNKVHLFFAKDLSLSGSQHLDLDEYIETEQVDINEVMNGMGHPPYVHALMGSALAMYLKQEILAG
ncbi:MAG: NUDIX hydrolase [Treponema sp.]|nr:NUDIX hydrolase [Treponema sp.]